MIAKYFIKNWSIYAWYFTIIIGLIITVVPFLWTFAGSFKENDVIFYQVSPFTFKKDLSRDGPVTALCMA